MLRINLKGMNSKLEKLEKRRVTYSEVAERSGLDRASLSRILNDPSRAPSTVVVDKLAQFFFTAFKPHHPNLTDGDLMKSVLVELVGVFPDSNEFKERLPKEALDHDYPVSVLWALHDAASVSNKEIRDRSYGVLKDFVTEGEAELRQLNASMAELKAMKESDVPLVKIEPTIRPKKVRRKGGRARR